ncbi:hypothetical protein EJB05_04072, partial [Eragrostis curvula]
MDAAAWPSSAFILVKNRLDVRDLTPARVGATINCATKKAYGCGKYGQSLLEGITLSASLADYPDLTSALSITLSAEAIQSVKAEVGSPHGKLEMKGAILTVTRHLLVLLVGFHGLHNGELDYFLVYDSADASLYMVPYLPDHLTARYTVKPVAVDTGADGHELVLMAREIWRGPAGVCLCTPATRANPRPDSFRTWTMKAQRLPNLPRCFSADETFSLGGMAFWADVSRGVLYCDLLDEVSVVEFQFIRLPDGYEIEEDPYVFDRTEEPRMTRTIGCAGSSIKFVCIDRRCSTLLPGNETVNVWTLDLQRRRWKRDEGFPCPWNEFSKRVGFMSATELRDVEPQYPTLMPDGELCLQLRWRNRARDRGEPRYNCSFHMCSKRPVWFGLYHDHYATRPFILPLNFLRKMFPPAPRQRKLPRIDIPRQVSKVHQVDRALHVDMPYPTTDRTKITASYNAIESKSVTADHEQKGKERYTSTMIPGQSWRFDFGVLISLNEEPRGSLVVEGNLAVATRHLLVLLVVFSHRHDGERTYYLARLRGYKHGPVLAGSPQGHPPPTA